MQKAYDVHWAVARQSRRTELHYKGVVDFSGGAYGILKAAVERELAMERGAEGTGTGSIQPDMDLQRRQLAVELKEMKERELELKKREQVVLEREQALKAKPSGALQSQVIPSVSKSHVFLQLVVFDDITQKSVPERLQT